MNTPESRRQFRSGTSVAPTPAAPRMLRIAAFGAALLSLAACNTVSGAGKDVSSVGHNVSRGADAAQRGITNSTGASSR
ncbi:entericidin A/B family lipoprotein [Acetobacter musti]|nr:entericidin A/B family lipoprotein [Acetobacter musti]